MGRSVISSSEQLDLLSCFGKRCSAGSFVTENWTVRFFHPLTWQRELRGEGNLGLQFVEKQWWDCHVSQSCFERARFQIIIPFSRA